VDDRQMPFSAVAESEIFQDLYRPLGLGHGIAATLFSSGQRFGVLSMHRGLVNGAFSQDGIALFERIAPHVVRAMQMHRQVQRAEQLAQGVALTLDHFSLAVFFVDATGGVRHMNRRAVELLSEPGCPLYVSAGRIAARKDGGTDRLRREIALAVAAAEGKLGPSADLLKFLRPDASEYLSAMIVPLRRPDQLGLVAPPMVAVFVTDTAQAPALDTHLIAQQFDLTPAEAQVAATLCSGASLAEAANGRHVSIETARTLLKRALAKTGTHSQGQLVALVTRSLALLRRRT
jgi:DNA-binding CsgD family transcriptional regulator